jgi:hypothetical protein
MQGRCSQRPGDQSAFAHSWSYRSSSAGGGLGISGAITDLGGGPASLPPRTPPAGSQPTYVPRN